jgi:hypothetical protein
MARNNLARVHSPVPQPVPATQPVPRPPAAPPRARPAPPAARIERRRHWPTLLAAAALAGGNLVGASYYAAPMADRVRHPLHAWLRPSGYVGQAAGIVALLIFVFLWLYPLRKRFKALAFTGSVGRWLDVHVAAALLMPLLLLIHSAWKFDGVIGLGFLAIMLVVASGVVGRFLYTRIPRAKSGAELTLDEVAAQRGALVDRIAGTTGLEHAAVARSLDLGAPRAAPQGVLATLVGMVAGDLTRWRQARALRRRWSTVAPSGRRPSRHALNEAVELAMREMALAQQVRVLEVTHRVFRWWHVAHRPVALTALIAVAIHVVVVVAVGATWFW